MLVFATVCECLAGEESFSLLQWSPVHVPHQSSIKEGQGRDSQSVIFPLGQGNQPGAAFLSPLIDAAQKPGVGKGGGSDHTDSALVIVSSIFAGWN